MTIPALLLGLVCAFLVGTLFHVVVDGGPGRLFLYLGLSTFGAAVGQVLAVAQGWSFMAVGPLRLGFAVAGSMAVLLVGHWLSLSQDKHNGRGDKV